MTTLIWPTMGAALAHARRTAVAPLTWNPVEHLLARTTFGATPSTRAYVHKYGSDAWWRLNVANAIKYPGYSGNTAVAKVGPQLTLNPYDTRQWLIGKGEEYGWDVMDQLARVTVGLQAYSAAPLYEVLVDFFSNHLNVPNWNGDVWTTRHGYDHDVIRKYAAGSFTDMLLASSKHPAMLIYLNLADSNKTAVNENYGRELLELHTVGLHYSENDVKNAARILTGRTLDEHQHYVFDDYIHATGPIQVLGFTNANASATGGEAAGDALLRYLAMHPYTAQHLAQKLCVRFVSDTPSSALVSAVANSYLANRTQILPTISTILRSTEFWESRGRKIKRPAENILSTVRLLGPKISDVANGVNGMRWAMSGSGNAPLEWTAPNGYPDVAAAWRSAGSLLQSWEHHLAVLDAWWDGLESVDVSPLFAGAATSGQAVSMLATALTAQPWSAAHLAVLQKFLAEPASTPLVKSSLRWLDTALAAVILDSPHFALR